MPLSLTVAVLALLLAPQNPETREKREGIEAHEKEMSSIWVTTDRRVVEGCAELGGVAIADSNSLDGLRRSAARLGADVIRLRTLRDDHIFGDIYRCADWDPQNLPTPTRTPTDQEMATRKWVEEMKSRVRLVGDPTLVSGCEKRGERSVNLLDRGEDLLRGGAVGARANVVLVRRFEGAQVVGEIFFCPVSEFRALPPPTAVYQSTPKP